MEFRVLGALEIVNGRRVCTPTAHKVRQVLALLTLYANKIVHADLLIKELWGDDPPKSAVTTTQTYIYQLRKLFAREGLDEPGSELLATKPPGYVLRLDPGQVDALVFQRLVRQGQRHLDSGEVAEASQVLRRALAMWTGPALVDVTPGQVLEGHVVALEEQRLRALELRIQADLRLGHHRELIGELRSTVITYPFNEWFHAQLISALCRCGRRNDALQVYQSLRNNLNCELGLEPSLELQRLHREVLVAGTPRPVTAQRAPIAVSQQAVA
jgi:SARP family transcriptional regulator, regulator of embCAB operon